MVTKASSTASSTSTDYDTESLFLFFWLPAGKDAFGFRNWETDLLNATGEIKQPKERPIAHYFHQRYKEIKGVNTDLGGLKLTGNLISCDGELTTRKIQSEFEYRTSPSNTGFFGKEITGEFSVFSNGLYLWRFNIRFQRNGDMSITDGRFANFLRDDFASKHLDELFHFGWFKKFQRSGEQKVEEILEGYQGALNYYQMDLLFNGIFNVNIIPSLFFESSNQSQSQSTQVNEVDERRFSLGNIIRSIALYGWRGVYKPLFSERKDYSYPLRSGESTDTNMIDIDVAFIPSHDHNQTVIASRELLYSRLTYAAMEQFIRVSINFGLLPYREGLEFCRKHLLKTSFMAKINKGTGQIYPPSLQALIIDYTLLEAYQNLILSKLSPLSNLFDLVDNLSEASIPMLIKDLMNSRGYSEWKYSDSTLTEAKKQLQRQISTIESDVRHIGNLMEAERDNRIISELTEARKVNEINVDQGATTIKLDTGDWNKVGLFIAITGLMIAAITMLVAITTWLYQNLVTDDAFIEELFTVIRQHSILTIIILLLFILFLGTPLMWFNWQSRRITRNTHDEQSFSSRIYDYSSIRHPLADGASKPQFESIIQNWRDSMPSIINPRNTKVPCRKYDYFTEIPTSGVQKYQYSFRSR